MIPSTRPLSSMRSRETMEETGPLRCGDRDDLYFTPTGASVAGTAWTQIGSPAAQPGWGEIGAVAGPGGPQAWGSWGVPTGAIAATAIVATKSAATADAPTGRAVGSPSRPGRSTCSGPSSRERLRIPGLSVGSCPWAAWYGGPEPVAVG